MSPHSENGAQSVAARGADFAALAERIRVAPFHQWLAVELSSADRGEVVVLAKWRDEMRSRLDPPIMHGGIVAALLDLAGLYAVLAGGQGVRTTAYLHVDYHKAVSPGPLRVKAKPIRLGRAISVAEAFLYGAADEPLASSRGGYVA